MITKTVWIKISIFAVIFLVGVFLSQKKESLNFELVRSSDLTAVASIKKQLSACEKNPYDEIKYEKSERGVCYQSTVVKIIDDYGLKTTVASLKDYMTTSEGKLLEGRRCHDLGHGIGIEAVKKGIPSREILTECNDWCVGGCLNGAAHIYVLTGHSPDELVKFCNIDGVSEKLQRMCYHGLGHGFMESANADISKTMDFCANIPIEMGQYECGHAAVMDYALLYTAPVRTIPEDIVGFCGQKKDIFQPSCFEFAGFLAYSRTVDTRDSFVTCRKVPSEYNIKCGQRIGEAYFSILQRDAEKIVKGCEIGRGAEIDNCMVGAVRSSIYGSDSSFGELGRKMCGLLTGSISKVNCFKFLGGEIEAVHGQDRRTETCSKLSEADRQDCDLVRVDRDKTMK